MSSRSGGSVELLGVVGACGRLCDLNRFDRVGGTDFAASLRGLALALAALAVAIYSMAGSVGVGCCSLLGGSVLR